MSAIEVFALCHAAFAYALVALCLYRWKRALNRYDEFRRRVDEGKYPPKSMSHAEGTKE